MIDEFVERWEENKSELREHFSSEHPDRYKDVVRKVVEALHDPARYQTPDPNRIHEINDGDYQGTLVYVVGAAGYQPHTYWYVRIAYGSCSGCDTLQAIRNYSHEPPTDQQAEDYMKLALHVVQKMKKMDDRAV